MLSRVLLSFAAAALLAGCRPGAPAGAGSSPPPEATAELAAFTPPAREADADQAVQAAVALLPPVPPKTAPTPGVAVLDPLEGAGDLAVFGRGCARWLNVAFGSVPQLGSTPLLTTLDRVRREMRRPGLTLNGNDLSTFASRSGATHLLTTRLEGAGADLTLTLQWVTAQGKPQGEALELKGAPGDIARTLPEARDALAKTLGAAAPLPAPEPQVAELELAGKLWWADLAPGMNKAPRELAAAGGSPLADLLRLRLDARGGTPETAKRLLKAWPGNALIYGYLGYYGARLLSPYKAQLAALRRAHPRCYALAHSDTWLRRVTRERAAEERAAADAVAAAPRNADAWLSLAWTTSEESEQLRYGRFADEVSAAEWSALNTIYTRWQRAAAAAAALDPEFGRAWNRVATAATFAGSPGLADAAMWAAIKLEPDNPEHYHWALQMYQPKWLGDAGKLAEVAQRAASRDYPETIEASSLADSLKLAGFAQEAAALVDRTSAKLEAAAAARPDDGLLHHRLGLLCRWQQKHPAARRHLREAARLMPDDARVQLDLALAEEKMGDLKSAIAAYQKSLKLDPSSPKTHYDLAWAYKASGRNEDARREFRAALELNPRYGEAHYGLGMLAQAEGDTKRAEAEYRLAIRGVAPWEAYRNLSDLLSRRKQFAEAIHYAEEALRRKPGEISALQVLAYAYGSSGKFKEAAEICRTLIEMNPAEPIAHLNLGEALCELGEREEGRKELEVARASGDPRLVKEADRLLRKYPLAD